jgi:hypothetical protein
MKKKVKIANNVRYNKRPIGKKKYKKYKTNFKRKKKT